LGDSRNIFSGQSQQVSSDDKERLLSQKGLVIWMTGYSGSGKTTLAYGLEKKLFDTGILTAVLDGDILRQGLTSDLGFSNEARTENVRRTAELAKQLASCGVVVICSLITPTNALRELAAGILSEQRFILYHIATPLHVCEERDVKGHYAKARAGQIKEFTGVSNPFELPLDARYTINTAGQRVEESLQTMFDHIFPLTKI
jgi:adenylylsulfate kinase